MLTPTPLTEAEKNLRMWEARLPLAEQSKRATQRTASRQFPQPHQRTERIAFCRQDTEAVARCLDEVRRAREAVIAAGGQVDEFYMPGPPATPAP